MVTQGRRSMPSSADPTGTAAVPPVASKAKDYTDRPEEVMAELDELRTRSIAKVLNKHFTDTTKQLAKEKAQADAALADLERRRSQTKQFVPSKGGDLNPYDQMYIQLQQKRAECRRKEKETMMLYQRYVMKYGKSAKVSSPLKMAAAATETETADTKAAATLDTLDENKEINFSDKTPKKAGGRSKEQLEEHNKQEAAKVKHFMSALNKFMADDQMKAISSKSDSDASELLDGELSSMRKDGMTPTKLERSHESRPEPSPAPEVKNFLSAMSNFMAQQKEREDDVVESEILVEEQDAKLKSRVDPEMVNEPEIPEESLGVISTQMVPATTDTSAATPEVGDTGLSGSDLIVETNPTISSLESPLGTVERSSKVDDQIEECNLKKMHAEKAIYKNDFPKTPDRAAKEDSANSTPTACTTPSDDLQHVEAPSFATTTVDDDVDERSIISGLTSVNSAFTRQVLDEIEEEMEDFIKTETEAIRKVLDTEEEELSASFGNSSSSLLGDVSVQVAMKAEAMAREMQKILDDFSNAEASVHASSGETCAKDRSRELEKKNYPYKFEPAIPGEDWYVYFDDNYEREFFLEKKSNRTQWDYPTSVPTARMEHPISSDDFLSDIQSVASSRGGSLSRRTSRRSMYRRQRRKRRTQRLLLSFFTLFSVLAAVFHWRVHYPDKNFSGAMAATLSSFKFQDTMNFLKDQLEYTFTDRRKREEEEEKARIFAKAQRERRARELAARNAKMEAARLAKEEAERKAKEEAERKARLKAAKEEEARLDAQRRLAEEEERLALAKKHEKEIRRPWACNIPFAYIIPRCNRLADVKPLFQETDLVFLQ
ncbi:hypothetical protein IV203_026592 [Nitzschia inconspicua]|uniref:WW domain-containing protein n=1 Tax=Nitzschia inconspicua TaxID=303405 RepID=A0A9K3LJK9_9STRA|nr:hypothetical protein IV203_026592 [Nitzschia inconspicua]